MSHISKRAGATLSLLVASLMTASATHASPGVPAEAGVRGHTARVTTMQFTLAAASGDECRATVSAYGKASGYAPRILKHQLAKHRAVSDWRTKVEARHGAKFSTWRNARDQDVRCEPALGALHCVAEASPCATAKAGFFY